MHLQSTSHDRRRFPDRRVMDEGPPPGQAERRIHAERRGFEVEELDFDERIALGRAHRRANLPG